MSKRSKKKSKKKYVSGVSQYNLFMFNRVEGLSSDDSDDLNYQPDDVFGTTSVKKRKKVNTELGNQPAKKKAKISNEQPKNETTTLDWSHRIPNEILHKIFVYAVFNFSAVPLLCRISQVCHKWCAVASNPSLWCSVDLSYLANSSKAKDDTWNFLKGQSFLKHVHNLNLCGWKRLTNLGLEVIVNHCTELRSINISYCKRLTAKGVSFLACHCSTLKSINMSYIQTDAVSNMSIKQLINEKGNQLEGLYLAGNKSIGTPSLVAIQSFCKNLKILDLSETSNGSFTIHVEKLQAGCSHMIELRLSQISLQPSIVTANEMDASTGFPDLELLSLASITGGPCIDDKFLKRLLKTSSKLRQLDLRGCDKITHQTLVNVPAVSLEQLLLSRCKMSWKDLFKVIRQRWSDSLKQLDVSWCNYLGDPAVLILAAGSSYTALRKLNLAGTGISSVAVRSIIDVCPNLTELNLTSCRGVPRGLKQLHYIESIRKLRKQLNIKPEQVEVDIVLP